MIIDIYNYRISPYPGNTCWKIQEKGAEDAKGEWKEAKYFPYDLKEALLKVRNLRRMQNESTTEVDKAIAELKKIDEEFIELLKNLKQDRPENFSD